MQAGDLEEAARAAHQLKGSCATVGAAVMLAEVRALERGIEAGDLHAIQAALACLVDAFEPFRTAALLFLR
ncbi:MAG: Hpt domain-containing protein [Acidobacteria bacterium]|nr:Hpt domain-containing protein [Acidobacteriota bacterium]